MAMQIVVPDLGESVVAATVLRWLKQQGEQVQQGETVVELETDKVNLEVRAPGAGTLSQIQHPEGSEVKIGDVLATLEAAPISAPSPQPTNVPAQTEQLAPVEKRNGDSNTVAAPKATPVAERMASEYGISLEQIPAGASDGRITRQDVARYVEQQKTPPTAPPPARTSPTAPSLQPASSAQSDGRQERVKMSRRRQTIAKRLVQAQQTSAMLTTFNEIDMSGVMQLRARRKESFRTRYGIGLGLTSFFVKASIAALKAFPQVNAEIQGDEIILKHYYDIGVAVGAAEGLVVPVIRDADRLSFPEIEQAISDLSAKSDKGTLSLDDLRGGTFTITNGGIFGSMLSTPILNPPQVGILGLHKIEDRPVAVEGQVVIRPMMYVALSYDHRIIDGREAVQFLVRIKELIQDPDALLLEA